MWMPALLIGPPVLCVLLVLQAMITIRHRAARAALILRLVGWGLFAFPLVTSPLLFHIPTVLGPFLDIIAWGGLFVGAWALSVVAWSLSASAARDENDRRKLSEN